MSFRTFFRLLRHNAFRDPSAEVDHSLATTAKDALHNCGRSEISSTGAVYDHIAKYAQNYADSFKKKDS